MGTAEGDHEIARTLPALAGRTVLLTGAAGDIGAAYLGALARAGANVVAADLAPLEPAGTELAAAATRQGPGNAVFTTCDITRDDDVHAAVDLAVAKFGRLDAVINNAAIYKALGAKRPLTKLTARDWDLVLRVNVRGTWQVIQAAVPVLREHGGGSVVNVSSVVTRTGTAGFAHYVAAKAAVEGLTRACARELGPYRIRVNAVSPGLVDDSASRAINDPGYLDAMPRTRCLPRNMVPEDLTGAVLWLISPASEFVTGQTLIVDGGGVFG
jgi:NAD(P)-dependent dehydrogenase (short-subunit alcohol dehydrogenase family)